MPQEFTISSYRHVKELRICQTEGVYTDGTLLLSGNAPSGAVGVLGNGTVTVNLSGTLAPGALIESLSVAGNVTGLGNLVIEYDGLSGSPIDVLNVGGLLDASGLTLDFAALGGPLTGSSYVFATYGSLNGTFSSINATPSGYFIDYAFGGNNIALVAVPEPSSIAFVSMVSAAWFARRRWKTRNRG